MNEYQFTLTFSIESASTVIDEIVERLGKEGCTDALLGVGRAGFVRLDFSRAAPSAAEAINSAVADVKRAIPDARLVETPNPSDRATGGNSA